MSCQLILRPPSPCFEPMDLDNGTNLSFQKYRETDISLIDIPSNTTARFEDLDIIIDTEPLNMDRSKLPPDLEDELALDMASLALDWRPLDPQPFKCRLTVNHPVDADVDVFKPFHPLFPCDWPDLNHNNDAKGSALLTQEQQHDTKISKNNVKGNLLIDKSKSNQDQLTTYNLNNVKPAEDKVNYKILITNSSKDRTKYLNPKLPTSLFWKLVHERNIDKLQDRKEAYRLLLERESDRSQSSGRYSTYGNLSTTSITSGHRRRSSISSFTSEHPSCRTFASLRLQPTFNENTGLDCIEGVELIDNPAFKLEEQNLALHHCHREKVVNCIIQRPSKKFESKTKRYKSSVNKNFVNRLLRSCEAYNKDKLKIEEAKQRREKKLKALALHSEFCQAVSNDEVVKQLLQSTETDKYQSNNQFWRKKVDLQRRMSEIIRNLKG
ncbi:uncharacterized protein L201_005031 [Kwoniella dendrophila CBS 6074]|uniref:Uncharacterized protein n=1 Tax=Kwoniella dendrophila CBS 6074 TaxID=1295534 RepID=A0AAX4JYZ8_9TREE